MTFIFISETFLQKNNPADAAAGIRSEQYGRTAKTPLRISPQGCWNRD